MPTYMKSFENTANYLAIFLICKTRITHFDFKIVSLFYYSVFCYKMYYKGKFSIYICIFLIN